MSAVAAAAAVYWYETWDANVSISLMIVVYVRAAWQDAYESSVSVRDLRSSAVLWRRYLLTHEREETNVVLSCLRPSRWVQQTHHWWVCLSRYSFSAVKFHLLTVVLWHCWFTVRNDISLSLSPFYRPFSRWTWVSRCLLKQRMMEVVATTGLLEL